MRTIFTLVSKDFRLFYRDREDFVIRKCLLRFSDELRGSGKILLLKEEIEIRAVDVLLFRVTRDPEAILLARE